VHWGTFSLAMHAWDQPAEDLLSASDKAGVQLIMPRLGEAVEPAHAQRPEPWWRTVDTIAPAREPGSPAPGTATEPDASAGLPKAMSWPID